MTTWTNETPLYDNLPALLNELEALIAIAVGPPGPQGNPGAGLDGEPGEPGMFIPGPPGTPGATGGAGADGAPGTPGAPGPIGFTGDDGVEGMFVPGGAGPPGTTGNTGLTGDAGVIGPIGLTGDEGDVGMFVPGGVGPQGTQGLTGNAGAIGPIGPLGFQGDDGDTGTFLPGNPGTPGADGATGLTGAAGSPGFPGDEGEQGLFGVPGNPGTPGADGAIGATGIPGSPGFPGDQGDEGLFGVPGTIGVNGAPGAAGPAGPPWPGTDGDDGYAVGIPGPTGPPGADGAPGSGGGGSSAPGFPGQDGDDGFFLPGPTGASGPSGDMWTKVVDESGTSFANWTSVDGTWSSDGTVIKQTATTASTFLDARLTAKTPTSLAVYEVELQIKSQPGPTNAIGGIVFGVDNAGSLGGLSVRLDSLTDVLLIDAEAGASHKSISTTINLDTWYKIRIVGTNSSANVYLDGTLMGSVRWYESGLPERDASHLGLYTYQAEVWFRNIKCWNLLQPGSTGAGPSATTVEKNLGSTAAWEGKITITDAAISGTSKVLVWQAPGPYTGKGTRADEASMAPVKISAVEPAAGSCTVYWESRLGFTQRPERYALPTQVAGGTLWVGEGKEPGPPTVLGKVSGNVKFSYLVFS